MVPVKGPVGKDQHGRTFRYVAQAVAAGIARPVRDAAFAGHVISVGRAALQGADGGGGQGGELHV